MNIPYQHRPERPCIALDFDGTLILENVLVAWVLFLVRRSSWPLRRKISFMLNSVARGVAAKVSSRRSGWAPWAVRTAFAAFRGVEEKSLAELVRCCDKGRPQGKTHILNLNPAVMAMLERIAVSCQMPPEVRVYSQGSSCAVIRQFLERADVRDRFHAIGISTASVIIHANSMETDGSGLLTGGIHGAILTKFSRIQHLPDGAMFIGDKGDEGVFKRIEGRSPIRFVNWQRRGTASTWAGVDIPARHPV